MEDNQQDDQKEILAGYLRDRRSDLAGKLDGLSEYDVRRPMTSSGSNLLGLVKHVASVELLYFTDVFGRPSGRELPWLDDDAEMDADFVAGPDETREEILELHRFAGEQAEATIAALPLDAPGVVPWWSEEKRDVTLQRIIVHLLAETARHAGHADIIRELIDGQVGQRLGDPNADHRDAAGWSAHRARVEELARGFLPGE